MGPEFTVGVLTKNFRLAFWKVLALLSEFRQYLIDIENQDNLLIIKGYSQLKRHCSNHVRWMTWIFWNSELKVTFYVCILQEIWIFSGFILELNEDTCFKSYYMKAHLKWTHRGTNIDAIIRHAA